MIDYIHKIQRLLKEDLISKRLAKLILIVNDSPFRIEENHLKRLDRFRFRAPEWYAPYIDHVKSVLKIRSRGIAEYTPI
jgi:hypothetical protein